MTEQNPYQSSQTIPSNKRSYVVPFTVAVLFVIAGLLGGLGFYAMKMRTAAMQAEAEAMRARQAAEQAMMEASQLIEKARSQAQE